MPGKILRREDQEHHHRQVDGDRNPERLAHARALQIVFQLNQQMRGKIGAREARCVPQRKLTVFPRRERRLVVSGGVRIEDIRMDQVRLEFKYIRRPSTL